MISKYGIFFRVIENKSFTKTAEQLGYSQSAVSQAVRSLEQELGSVLIERGKDGIKLTSDGESFMPYIGGIYNAEKALYMKQSEVSGLINSTVRIGTFTSVGRNLLPPLMKQFKAEYPGVHFDLKQGEYTSIGGWIRENSVDFGFINTGSVSGLTVQELYRDEMMAVLPAGHPLASQQSVSLKQLAKESFILLDEGEHSVPLDAFLKKGLSPDIEYKVYDDYTILAMVKQNLGVSVMYRFVLPGYDDGIEVRPINENPERTIALAWKNWDTMPLAARRFASFIIKHTPEVLKTMPGHIA